MAITDAYETAANYRNRITKSDTGDDAAILADLTSITRMIEKELELTFNKDAAGVARDFYPDFDDQVLPDAQRILFLNAGLSATPTLVQSDDNDDGTPDTTWTVTTDYRPWPFNADKGSEPRPFTGLWLPPNSSKSFFKDRLIRVTAQWGWPAVPEPIKSATIQLTAILRLEGNRGSATVSELGQLVTMSPQAAGIVERLKNRYARRAGVSI